MKYSADTMLAMMRMKATATKMCMETTDDRNRQRAIDAIIAPALSGHAAQAGRMMMSSHAASRFMLAGAPRLKRAAFGRAGSKRSWPV